MRQTTVSAPVFSLLERYPCRQGFIEELCELFPANGQECYPKAVYVFGQGATGKTAIVQEFLELYRHQGLARTAFVDCIECYSLKVMLELLMEQLTMTEESSSSHEGTTEDGEEPATDHEALCFERMEQFVEYLSGCDYYVSGIGSSSQKVPINNYVVALDTAERLRDMDCNILCSLLRLQEYTRLNISVILISRLPLEKFYPRSGLNEEILTIHCPAYNRAEILTILGARFANSVRPKIQKWFDRKHTTAPTEEQYQILEQINEDFYGNYLNIFMSVFFKACRDLRELQITAESCFQDYVRPVLDGSIEVENVTRLWRSITDTFRAAMAQLYVRAEKYSTTEPKVLFLFLIQKILNNF